MSLEVVELELFCAFNKDSRTFATGPRNNDWVSFDASGKTVESCRLQFLGLMRKSPIQSSGYCGVGDRNLGNQPFWRNSPVELSVCLWTTVFRILEAESSRRLDPIK